MDLTTGAGGRGAVGGQPAASELSCAARLAVGGTAATDTLLRTAVASVLSVPMLTWALPQNIWRERARLGLYAELAERADASATFRAPAEDTPVTTLPAPRSAFVPRGARIEMLRFDSRFEAINPAVRESYAGFTENRTAWAQRWRHEDGPRPTLCVIHGFGASPHWLNSAFFALPWLFEQGYDVLLYVLPFHGVRQPKTVPFSGWGLFAHGIAHFNEAILHGVHDLRVFVEHLIAGGVEQVGVTGLSLGGYIAALAAAVEDRLAVSIPNAPVASMDRLISQWFPAGVLVAAGTRVAGIDRDELDSVLAVHSPLTYEPLLARERRMIIGGLGDRLAPPEQSLLLWEHWSRCRLHWFPGNHVIHVNRRAYLKEMLSFMNDTGFSA
jgi:pimeloyl-ACP methyl ester carboxylesterase